MQHNIPHVVGELTEAPYNPRTITDSAREGLKASMHSFGDMSGLVFNMKTGHMVSGHQRRSTFPPDAKIEDYAPGEDEHGTVGYGYVNHDGGRWRIRFVHWPLEKEKLANISANAPTIQGQFTDNLVDLLDEVKGIFPEEFDKMLLFAIPEIEGLVAPEKEEEDGETGKTKDEAEIATAPFESYNIVYILSKRAMDDPVMQSIFDLQPVKDLKVGFNHGKVTEKFNVGLGRVITFERFLERLRWIIAHKDQLEALLAGKGEAPDVSLE